MTISRTITLELVVAKNMTEDGKYELSIKTDRYRNIPAEIFVFKRNIYDTTDEFSHVATPMDLNSLSKYSPGSGTVYFLDHTVELEFDSVETMSNTETLIIADVTKLKEDWASVFDGIDTTYRVVV
jgi:hypothetical protein